MKLLIVFFTLILILLILIFPVKTRFMAHFNLLKSRGYYSIKILFFKILCGMIYIKDGKVYVSNLTDAIFPRDSSLFMKELIKIFFKKIYVKKMEFFFTGGFAEDSFNSAILCGSVSSIVQTFYSVISQKYEGAKLYEDIKPTFNKDNLELTADVVVSISFINVLFAIIVAKIKSNKLRREQNEG